jgi:hypothetical protein
MSAPRDLPSSAPWTDPPIARQAASQDHQELFAEYIEFMGDAIRLAEIWWEGVIRARELAGADRRSAIDSAYQLRFAGPASSPEVVWTIRTFWLRCVALNHKHPEKQGVPPEVFLLYWLLDEMHDEWVQVISGMPYWPIGLDANGDWV